MPPEFRAGAALEALLFVDLDGDLAPEAIVGEPNRPLLQRNDGTGRFEPVGPPVKQVLTQAVAGDVDGDGDPDVVVAGPSPVIELWLNDGVGNLARAAQQFGTTTDAGIRGLALTDFDGDGDLDLYSANQAQDQLFRNDGQGGFTDVTATNLPSDVALSSDVLVLDIDGDGNLDLVLEDGVGGLSGLRRIPGGYRAVLALVAPGDPFYATQVAVGDLEGDGDVDVIHYDGVAQSANGAARVLANRSQQLEAPLPARLGGSLDLYVDAREAGVARGAIAWPAFAAAPASAPLSIPGLGVLRLDPGSLVLDAPLFIGSGVGEGLRRLPVPNDPALVDVVLPCQAIVAPGGDLNRARLTGRVDVRLIR